MTNLAACRSYQTQKTANFLMFDRYPFVLITLLKLSFGIYRVLRAIGLDHRIFRHHFLAAMCPQVLYRQIRQEHRLLMMRR